MMLKTMDKCVVFWPLAYSGKLFLNVLSFMSYRPKFSDLYEERCFYLSQE